MASNDLRLDVFQGSVCFRVFIGILFGSMLVSSSIDCIGCDPMLSVPICFLVIATVLHFLELADEVKLSYRSDQACRR
ncbi:hypothetical protein A0O30_19555 [Pseudomonas sp. LLC-1]|nr:hypothetical protein A0O30_19555 [Pseudomonas sp. LLC-1]